MGKRINGKRQSGRVLLFLILIVIVFYQGWKISGLNSKLKGVTVLDWSADSLYVTNAFLVERPLVVITPEFVDNILQPGSPFNDGRTYQELLDEYLRYGSADLYGSPRRTGNIKRIHEGVDFYVPEDTPVYPLFPFGIVTEVSDDPDFVFLTGGLENGVRVDSVGVEYGKIVRILYPEGMESLYAHLNEIFVEVGDIVDKDSMVGLTGYTGNIRNSGKPSHLHLELRTVGNESFNPDYRLSYRHHNFRDFVNKLLDLEQDL